MYKYTLIIVMLSSAVSIMRATPRDEQERYRQTVSNLQRIAQKNHFKVSFIKALSTQNRAMVQSHNNDHDNVSLQYSDLNSEYSSLSNGSDISEISLSSDHNAQPVHISQSTMNAPTRHAPVRLNVMVPIQKKPASKIEAIAQRQGLVLITAASNNRSASNYKFTIPDVFNDYKIIHNPPADPLAMLAAVSTVKHTFRQNSQQKS